MYTLNNPKILFGTAFEPSILYPNRFDLRIYIGTNIIRLQIPSIGQCQPV